MLVVMAAMRQEVSALRGCTAAGSVEGCRLFRAGHGDKEVLVVQTGVGRENVERSARAILGKYPVSALVSFGFGGGLTDGLNIGDIVLCSDLCAEGSPSCLCDSGLLEAAGHVDGGRNRVVRGTGVSVGQPAATEAMKRTLAAAFKADSVDMESYWVGRIATEKRVPFLTVRVVSDTVRDSLPEMEGMLGGGGKIRWRGLLAGIISHPGRLLPMLRLYRNMKKAGTSLGSYMDRLTEKLA
jgi:adenosylhomocysteine nucleosidase